MTTDNSQLTPLALHAKQRTDKVHTQLRDAMRKIEAEVEAADGIYPFNGGRLSQAELCRRASVSQVTLLGAAHKAAMKPEVDAWLARMTTAMKTGAKTVRRTVTERADNWKAQFEAIAQRYHEAELELAAARLEIARLGSALEQAKANTACYTGLRIV